MPRKPITLLQVQYLLCWRSKTYSQQGSKGMLVYDEEQFIENSYHIAHLFAIKPITVLFYEQILYIN